MKKTLCILLEADEGEEINEKMLYSALDEMMAAVDGRKFHVERGDYSAFGMKTMRLVLPREAYYRGVEKGFWDDKAE